MKAYDSEEEGSSWDWNETVYILLQHKWKFLLCLALGLGAAAFVYLSREPLYQSEAKLLVRYVLERSAIDPVDSQVGTSGGRYSDSVINSEVEILTSWDLAMKVAEEIGPQTLLPGSPAPVPKIQAASVVRGGLVVKAAKGSNVISVAYMNRDPELATRVLESLVRIYFDKHLSVHRSLGAFDFVSTQSNDARARLLQVDEELKQLKATLGIVSLAEATNTTQSLITKKREELASAESKMAGQRARVKAVEDWLTTTRGSSAASSAPATTADTQQYQVITAQLAALRREGLDLLARFTPENRLVRANREQVARLEAQQLTLEQRFPELIASGRSGDGSGSGGLDLLHEKTQLAVWEAETETARAQLKLLQSTADELASVTPRIMELERRKEVEEANYKYFEASLEKARVDEALDPSKIPNISAVQNPSPAGPVTPDLNKIMLGLVGGGAALGLATAFVSGFVLDRTIKRARELETKLGLSCLVTIPRYANGRKLRRASAVTSDANVRDYQLPTTGRSERLQPEIERFLRPHAEALRDRLILSLHLAGKTHNPKLVAVTGCTKDSGASTLAESLASSLSSMGGGKVLLVDMHFTRPAGNGRFAGTPKFSLFEMLAPGRDVAPAAENLYLATVASPAKEEPTQVIPATFHDLVPRFKGSDFDYVIFDTPPVSESSTSLVMASFMDKVLLVVEAGKATPNAVKRAHADLSIAKADVAIVLNKAEDHGPDWLNDN